MMDMMSTLTKNMLTSNGVAAVEEVETAGVAVHVVAAVARQERAKRENQARQLLAKS